MIKIDKIVAYQDYVDGKKLVLQKTETHIQQKYEEDAVWTNLIALSDLKGIDGINGYDIRWKPNTAYQRDSVVLYQGKFWKAPIDIPPKINFDNVYDFVKIELPIITIAGNMTDEAFHVVSNTQLNLISQGSASGIRSIWGDGFCNFENTSEVQIIGDDIIELSFNSGDPATTAQIEAIFFTNVYTLEVLDAGYTNLQWFDIPPRLQKLYVQYCSGLVGFGGKGKHLIELDISGTNMQDVGVFNELDSLKILNFMDGISANVTFGELPSLESIYISNSMMQSLDLSYSVNLNSIDAVGANNLQQILIPDFSLEGANQQFSFIDIGFSGMANQIPFDIDEMSSDIKYLLDRLPARQNDTTGVIAVGDNGQLATLMNQYIQEMSRTINWEVYGG